jgi:hypothetical protein
MVFEASAPKRLLTPTVRRVRGVEVVVKIFFLTRTACEAVGGVLGMMRVKKGKKGN